MLFILSQNLKTVLSRRILRYLEWSIDEKSGIRRQDASTVFSSVAASDVGYYTAVRFLTKNINKIYNYFGPKATRLGRYIDAVAEQMISEEELVELRKLTEDHEKLLTESQLSVKQSLETVAVNVAWHQKYYQSITEVLAL